MRRLVIVLPGLADSDPSPLRETLPTLSRLAEEGTVWKLRKLEPTETPEAAWLGLNPSTVRLRQGPLTVSWLGHDPPERSTHFHLSLLSVTDDKVSEAGFITDEEGKVLKDQFKILGSKLGTLLVGEKADHGFVWEDWGDLESTSADDAIQSGYLASLPLGDFEKPLRRLIDDSVNHLSGLELNQRRVDEGKPPVNLLWPWGHGVRTPVPNLALRRGEPTVVLSPEIRMAGLTRLAGYRNLGRSRFGNGLNSDWEGLVKDILVQAFPAIVVSSVFERLLKLGREEERHWLVKEVDGRLLAPLVEQLRGKPFRITLLVPGEQGLALTYDSSAKIQNSMPFDERALDEKLVGMTNPWELIHSALA